MLSIAVPIILFIKIYLSILYEMELLYVVFERNYCTRKQKILIYKILIGNYSFNYNYEVNALMSHEVMTRLYYYLYSFKKII